MTATADLKIVNHARSTTDTAITYLLSVIRIHGGYHAMREDRIHLDRIRDALRTRHVGYQAAAARLVADRAAIVARAAEEFAGLGENWITEAAQDLEAVALNAESALTDVATRRGLPLAESSDVARDWNVPVS